MAFPDSPTISSTSAVSGSGRCLAMIASPEIAEMHGKMHEAETAFGIAERNYVRVQKSENRVAVLQAKARLDEADLILCVGARLGEMTTGGYTLVDFDARWERLKEIVAPYRIASGTALPFADGRFYTHTFILFGDIHANAQGHGLMAEIFLRALGYAE